MSALYQSDWLLARVPRACPDRHHGQHCVTGHANRHYECRNQRLRDAAQWVGLENELRGAIAMMHPQEAKQHFHEGMTAGFYLGAFMSALLGAICYFYFH